eukprot:jgi/Ulvmu1/10775/UM069_0009.1
MLGLSLAEIGKRAAEGLTSQTDDAQEDVQSCFSGLSMRQQNGSGDVATAARDASRKAGAQSENNVETVSIDGGSARVDYDRSSSDIWSYDGHDHLTDLSDETPRDDLAEIPRETAGHDGHPTNPTPPTKSHSRADPRPADSPNLPHRTSGHSPPRPDWKAPVEQTPQPTRPWTHDRCPESPDVATTDTTAVAEPKSPSAASTASSMSTPVDTDWHLVTPPADSELPPALRQGQRTPPVLQRSLRRSRMHASLHAQSRPPAPDSAQSVVLQSGGHSTGLGSDASEAMNACEVSPMLRASAMSSVLDSDMHEPLRTPLAMPSADSGSPEGRVEPPQLQRHRHSRCSGGSSATRAEASLRPATRIPRASASKRARRLPAHPTSFTPLPGAHGVAGWATGVLRMLCWMLFAIAVACALGSAYALLIHGLPLPHSARSTPSVAEVRQLGSLLQALDTGFSVPEDAAAGGDTFRTARRRGSVDVAAYTRRSTLAAALEVVSAAEVAQGRLRVSMEHVGAPVPAAWENAATALDATVSDLKRNQLLDLTVALQAAEAARADITAATLQLDRIACAAHSVHSAQRGNNTNLAAFVEELSPEDAHSTHTTLRAVEALQPHVFRKSDLWRESVAKAAHAWVSLNATCSAAEDRFVALATWTAARRRPSATSVARVALYHFKRQLAGHALHVSATGAAWLRRTRDAVQRSAQRSGQLLQRAGARARRSVHRSRAWVDGAVAQGATWLGDVAGSVRTHAVDAIGKAKQQVHEHGLDAEITKAWQDVKRMAAPIVDDVAPPAARAKVSQRWAAAKASVAQRGQRVMAKLPGSFHAWRSSGQRKPAGDTNQPEPLRHDASAPPTLAAPQRQPEPATGVCRAPPPVAADTVDTARQSANATLAAAATAATAGGPGPAWPAVLVPATGMMPLLLPNSSSSSGAARRVNGAWRGAGGLAQHASRGGAVEASGPQKELDQIAELTAPWEILVLTPKLLRHAVNALGAELADLLDAAAVVSADAEDACAMHGGHACDVQRLLGGSVQFAKTESKSMAPRFGGGCACRWDRCRGCEGEGSICWCGLEGVVREVWGSGARA